MLTPRHMMVERFRRPPFSSSGGHPVEVSLCMRLVAPCVQLMIRVQDASKKTGPCQQASWGTGAHARRSMRSLCAAVVESEYFGAPPNVWPSVLLTQFPLKQGRVRVCS